MDGSEDTHISGGRPPRRPGYDVLWRRITQAAGLLLAFAEFTIARSTGKPIDQNILLFAAMLIGVPLAVGRGGGGDRG